MEKNKMLIALLEEYKKATIELNEILLTISLDDFEQIRDEETEDPDCESIQTLVFHMVHSGHTYANYINTLSAIPWYEYDGTVDTPAKGITAINGMINYTEKAFERIWEKDNAAIEKWIFHTRWGVTYDFEQLMEHAIVHILRHRRQISNFLKT